MYKPSYIDWFLEKAKDHPDLGIRSMLSTAQKLGPPDVVRTWNLPLQSTCLRLGFASPVCRDRCYAWHMALDRPEVFKRAEKNYAIAQRQDFSTLMIGAILTARVSHFRIHDFGDFFSAAYLSAWTEVCRLLPEIKFWLYTRAWERFDFRELASLGNCKVNLSYDRSMPAPPKIPNTDSVFLADTDFDAPAEKSLIAFRASSIRKLVPLRVMGQTIVCPKENGTSDVAHCVECSICL